MEWESGSVIYSRELYVMLSLLGNFSNAKSENHGNLLIDMKKKLSQRRCEWKLELCETDSVRHFISFL